jgi:23S rRNA (guanosine2251-2'-O)-methyltransferase
VTARGARVRNRIILYGVHPVEETIKAGRRRIFEVFLARDAAKLANLARMAEDAQIPLSHLSSQDLGALSRTAHHQGVAAAVAPFPYVEIEDLRDLVSETQGPLLMLDRVQDPANLGSILRSAECLGGGGLILPMDQAANVTPLVEKASAGASAYLPVCRVVNLARCIDQMKDQGYWIYAAHAAAATVLHEIDLTNRVMMVLGSEGKGVRRLVRERSDGDISIPLMGRLSSLNVAQAATVMLAESLRQRLAHSAT